VRQDEGAPVAESHRPHSESVLASEEAETIPFIEWERGCRVRSFEDVLAMPQFGACETRSARQRTRGPVSRRPPWRRPRGRDPVLFRSPPRAFRFAPLPQRFAADGTDAFTNPTAPSRAHRKLLAPRRPQITRDRRRCFGSSPRPHRAGTGPRFCSCGITSARRREAAGTRAGRDGTTPPGASDLDFR